MDMAAHIQREYHQAMNTARRKLEDWEVAECMALKSEIAAANANGGRRLTQEFLAQELGMTQGNLSSHLNGKRAITKDLAVKVALATGIPVERFSPRLAKEIVAMAQAVQQPTEKPPSGAFNAGQMAELMGLATPRSRAVLQRITQAADEGRLSEADIDLLDQIAARFETNSRPQVRGEGSHKRLRERLQNDDSHPKQ